MSCQQPLLSIWKTKPLPILLVPWTLEKGHVIQARLLDCLSWEAPSIYSSRKNTWKPSGLGSSKGAATWSVDSCKPLSLFQLLSSQRLGEQFPWNVWELQNPSYKVLICLSEKESVSVACNQCALMWEVSVTQLCSTLSDPTDYSPPGSSVHGILQARILEWVAMPFCRGSSEPRDQTWVSSVWSTREHGKKGVDPSVEGKLALN